MRALYVVVAVLAVGVVLTPSLEAGPLSLSESVAIELIDGAGDRDSTVTVMALDPQSGCDFGFWNHKTDSFQQIKTAVNYFDGGTVVDFAIHDYKSGATTRLSDGTATMVFTGWLPGSYSENPVRKSGFWKGVTITWESTNHDYVVVFGGDKDGLAPVPEPTTLALLGGGIAAVVAAARRRRRRTGF